VDVGSFHTRLFGVVAKQQRVDVCTELRQLASDDETFLLSVITAFPWMLLC
jgi:hypothetical protein